MTEIMGVACAVLGGLVFVEAWALTAMSGMLRRATVREREWQETVKRWETVVETEIDTREKWREAALRFERVAEGYRQCSQAGMSFTPGA